MKKERVRVYNRNTGTINNYQCFRSKKEMLSFLNDKRNFCSFELAFNIRKNLGDCNLELLQRIDEVLHYSWDPCGVAGEAGARDEYTSYAIEVYNIVKSRGDQAREAVSAYLDDVMTRMMGLKKSDNTDIVDMIFNHKEFIDTITSND